VGKEVLAGEPFKLTVGSPVAAAAPGHTRTRMVLLFALAENIH